MNYSLTRATLWNFTGYLYLILASFFSIPILVSSLGITEFGHYTLVIATITLASSIDLGLSAAVVRELSARSKHHHPSLWATSHRLFLITGLLAAIIATSIVISFDPDPLILPLTFFHTLTGHLLAHYLTLPQAHGRFDLYNLRTFIVGTANTLLAALLAYLGFGIDLIILAQLTTSLLTIFFLARYVYNHFGILPSTVSHSHARDLLGFGVKNQVGKLMGQLGAQYAKFLLAPLGALVVSAYSIAQNIVLKLAGGLTQLATALYPASSKGQGSKELRHLYYRLQLALLVIAIFGVCLYRLLGLPFLSWWLKEPTLIAAVHAVLTRLVCYLAILILTPIPAVILDSHDRPGLTSAFTTATVGLEIFFSLLLIPNFGLLGPPTAALLSVSLTTPLLLYSTHLVLLSKASLEHSRKVK